MTTRGVTVPKTAGIRRRLTRRAAPLGFLVLLLVFWELGSRLSGIPTWLLPAPSQVLAESLVFGPEFPRHILATTVETVAGFALATVIGIALGLAFASIDLLERSVYPALVALQSVPKVALAPLFLMWVGYGLAMKVLVVFLVSLFPIVVSTTTGLKAVPESLIQMVRAFKATPLVELTQIRLPYSVPYIFIGLRVAITLAASGAVIGEFVGAAAGLGYLITIATQQFRTSLAFGSIVLLAVLSIALFYIVDLLQHLLFPWSLKVHGGGRDAL